MFPSAKYYSKQDTPIQSTDHDLSWLKSGSYQMTLLEEKKYEDTEIVSDVELQLSGRKRSKQTKKRHEKKQYKQRKLTKHQHLHDSKPASIWIDETKLITNEYFCCDNQPDWSNFSYNSLYTGNIAYYCRIFGNHCIGIGHGAITFTDQKGIPLKNKIDSRYFENKILDSSYVDLLVKKTNEISKEKTVSKDFLPIEICATASGFKQMSHVSETPEVHIGKMAGEYNARLLDNPHDIQLWMEFIKFQDENLNWGKLPIAGAPLSDTKIINVSESIFRQKLALTERKIAIFERALQQNPLSEQLLVGHMELVRKIWDTEKLVRQWKDIVFKQPNRSLLWLKYIDFCQSRFSFYRSSSISSLYQKAISTLSSISCGLLLSHEPEPDAEQKILALFLLYCNFLKHSGFVEKAIALFQALVEFNFCSPEYFFESQNLDSVKERNDAFEVYWDGDAAKIGEKGAMGWKGWFEYQSTGVKEEDRQLLGVVDEKDIHLLCANNLHSMSNTDEEIVKGKPVHIGLTELEMHREYTSCLPGMLLVDKVDIDLDHIILFNDVSPCLFLIQNKQLQITLLLEFLRFLGAPINNVSVITTTFPDIAHMIADPLELLHSTLGMPVSIVSSMMYQPRLPVSDLLTLANSSFQDILSNCGNSSYVPSSLKAFTTRLFSHCLSIIKNIEISPSLKSSLICSWLLYELHHIPSPEVMYNFTVPECLQKLSISLLPSISLEHYRLMWEFINRLEPVLSAKKMSLLSEALLHPFTFSPPPQGTCFFVFCQMFVECMLKICNPISCYCKHLPSSNLALFSLVKVSQSDFNPTMLPVSCVKLSSYQLQTASRFYEEISSHILQLHSNTPQIEIFSKLGCCFYFKYLTEGIDLSCQWLHKFLHAFSICNHPQCSGLVEELYIMVIKLMEAHSKKNHIKPKILRDILCSALSKFPHHVWFLQMLVKSEERSFNTGQLRRFFSSLIHKNTSTDIPTLFAVTSEISRYHKVKELAGVYMEGPSSGLLQRTRSYFVQGLQTKTSHSSPALWRIYIKFEIVYGSKDNAKALFYQAIQQCPWVKMLYFDGIQYFPEDAQKITEMMEEKELRVRSVLEEVELLLH